MSTGNRPSIVGAGEAGPAATMEPDPKAVHETNRRFWDESGSAVLGTTALPMYGAFISEERCRLFGEVAGRRMLEVGCGSGHSLQYLGERGAAELWGIDLSEKQLEKTARHLASHGLSARLVCTPMETECGIPADYFDYVFSVYAIGWATDLDAAFARIATYLKKDGVFIFSWSHPVHKCVALEDGAFLFKRSYFDESWYSAALGEGTLALADRMLSTYLNALARAGFALERMVEAPDEERVRAQSGKDDFAKKAALLPVTFVIKARKL